MSANLPLPSVAIVGINKECASVLSLLIETGRASIVRVLNPEWEDLKDLCTFPSLDIIIETTNDPAVYQKLKRLNLGATDIMSGLSARILFAAEIHRDGREDPIKSENEQKVLENLYAIGQAVHLTKNKEELLKLVLNVAIRSTGADSGSIMLLDERKRYLKIETAKGLDASIVRLTAQKLGKGIAGTVAKTGKPLLIKGAADKKYFAGGQERRDLVSAICVPLVMRRETVGTLCVNSKNPLRIFGEEDLEFARKIAGLTVEIIKTSKEYENSVGENRISMLLGDARDILNFKYPLRERINLLVLKLANYFNGEICNYYDYSAEMGVFLARASSSVNIRLLQGTKLKLHDYFAGQVIRSRRTVSLLQPVKGQDRKKWYIAAPVEIDGEMAGLLFLHFLSERADMSEEITALEKVASMLSAEIKKESEVESYKAQSVKFSAISEVTFDLASAKTLADLGTTIVSHACIILEAESAILRLADPLTKELKAANSFSLKRSFQLKMLEEFDAYVSRDVVKDKVAACIRDLGKSKLPHKEGLARSVMCMYLERDGRLLGTLSIYDKKSLDLYDSRSFSARDKEIFLSFCLQAAKAIDRFAGK
jgi:GAF domain-containing protein